jgi:hypothetical protein
MLQEPYCIVGKPAPSPVQTPNPEAEAVMVKLMNRIADSKRFKKPPQFELTQQNKKPA